MTIKEHSKTERLNGHRYRRGNYRKTNNFNCTQFGWPKPYLVLDTPQDDFKPENYPNEWHCAICEARRTPYAVTGAPLEQLIEENAKAQLVALNTLSGREYHNERI